MATNPYQLIHSYSGPFSTYMHGLTKREYFAAMAMQGILSNPALFNMKNEVDVQKVSVQIADDFITELNKTGINEHQTHP